MKDQSFYISKLLIKKHHSFLTKEEEEVLNTWLASNPKNQELANDLLEKAKSGVDLSIFEKFDEEAAFQSFQAKNKGRRFGFIPYAAAILFAIGLGYVFFLNKPEAADNRFTQIESVKHQNDVLPAGNGAYLFNEEGEQVQVEGNVVVQKNGDISSEKGESLLGKEDQPSMENTLVVPSARFFNLTLSDGTKVWINANSQLRFPSVFSAHERRVKVKGEVYFEVAKDAERPFYVESEGAEIKVLGTHFNVNSYSAFCKTTLAEGKVQVSNGKKTVELIPGEQAIISESKVDVGEANVEKDLAWKNNIFQFKGDNIVNIAKQLQNWYDLEISFSKEVSLTQTYTGEIKRDAKLSEVLNMLEYVSSLDFRIQGNKLLILNK
ncbi:FecR family protein [Sphingobacterium cellulitidis]|uniref:FecR family protein n=1 Tax=Sphingobacterium cellulitidis TaxID=1768011 RepID=UPI003C7986C6